MTNVPSANDAGVDDVDLEEAQRFLNWLGAKNCSFQSFDDHAERKDSRLASIRHGSLGDHADKLIELNQRGAGVFVAMNETDLKGRQQENIKRVRAFALDLDGSPLDPVLECQLKPHIIIESSPNRWHVYWCVQQFPLDQFEDVQRAIAKRFNGDPEIAKLTHCARLPGFFHNKGKRFRTKIIELNNLDDYCAEQLLDEFPAEKKPYRSSISGNGSIVLPAGAPLIAAEKFAEQCWSQGDIFLLRAWRGAFYIWTGTHYREYPDEKVERDLYEFLSKAVVQSHSGAVAPYNPTKGKIEQVAHALRRGVQIDRDREVPCWLDSERHSLPADNLISVRNGILDLETRELLPHDPHFFTTSSIPLDYDPAAPRPKRWLKFLEELWPTDELPEFCLQEIMGYLLTNDNRQQKLFLIVGPKRGGKGTIVDVLQQLLGSENVVYPTLKSIAGEFGRWPLIDKKLAVIADARLGPKADAHAVAEHLLSISGGDPQTINRKNQAFWTGKLGVRFLITTNELPAIADASGTLTSRFVLLRLTESFYGREELDLKRKLYAELPGILSWALDGLDRLSKRGRFKLPQSSLDSIRQLEDLGSPGSAFLREWCETGADCKVNVKEVYNAYRIWCEDVGEKPLPRHVFGKGLHAIVPTLRTTGVGAGRTYVGLGLSAEGKEQYDRAAEQAQGRGRR